MILTTPVFHTCTSSNDGCQRKCGNVQDNKTLVNPVCDKLLTDAESNDKLMRTNRQQQQPDTSRVEILISLETVSKEIYFSVVANPRAIPSNISCRDSARTTRKPLIADTNDGWFTKKY